MLRRGTRKGLDMGIQLNELARSAFAVAKGAIEDGKQAMPTFLAVLPDNELAIILAPWDSDESKAGTFQALRAMFAEKNVKAYAFVSECWVTKWDKPEEWDGTAPSEDPRRIDTLMVDAHTRDGEQVSLIAEIETLPSGKRAVIQEPESRVLEKASGRGANLLMPEGAQGLRH